MFFKVWTSFTFSSTIVEQVLNYTTDIHMTTEIWFTWDRASAGARTPNQGTISSKAQWEVWMFWWRQRVIAQPGSHQTQRHSLRGIFWACSLPLYPSSSFSFQQWWSVARIYLFSRGSFKFPSSQEQMLCLGSGKDIGMVSERARPTVKHRSCCEVDLTDAPRWHNSDSPSLHLYVSFVPFSNRRRSGSDYGSNSDRGGVGKLTARWGKCGVF